MHPIMAAILVAEVALPAPDALTVLCDGTAAPITMNVTEGYYCDGTCDRLLPITTNGQQITMGAGSDQRIFDRTAQRLHTAKDGAAIEAVCRAQPYQAAPAAALEAFRLSLPDAD